MDQCVPAKGAECSASVQSHIQISIDRPAEAASKGLTLDEVRQGLREYSQAITRVDKDLEILKTQLMNMREQDLHLLKQLIQVGDTITKLGRSHERRGGRRSSHKASKEMMASAVDLSVTLRRFRDRSSSSTFSGDYSTVPLVRRQSDSHVCMLTPRADVRSWGSSHRGSGSSTDWWSEDTLGSSEDGLDTLGSDDDTLDVPHAPSTTATLPNITTTPATTISTTSTTTNPTTSEHNNQAKEDEISAADVPPDHFQRPKSHSIVAATFLSRPKLSGGNSVYSDILNQNVRLWKDRLEHAQSVRQKVSILEEES